MFSPILARMAGSGLVQPNELGPGFIRYTMPAFELRRLLDEARQRNESFSLEYTHLSNYNANQAEMSTGLKVQLWEDGKGSKTCTLIDQNTPCSPEELVFLPPLGYWSKLVAFWPHPIITGEAEVHKGGYCFSE